MQTSFSRKTCFAAVAAATIVGFTGLLLDRSLDLTYDSALPTGSSIGIPGDAEDRKKRMREVEAVMKALGLDMSMWPS